MRRRAFSSYQLADGTLCNLSWRPSGAVYGLLAAYAVNQALEEGKPVWKSFGIVAIYVIGTYSVGVDFLGHFGGILGGAALSLLLLRKR